MILFDNRVCFLDITVASCLFSVRAAIFKNPKFSVEKESGVRLKIELFANDIISYQRSWTGWHYSINHS